MLYGVCMIDDEGDETIISELLSYEDVSRIIGEHLLSGNTDGLLVKRRCCSSMSKRVLTSPEAEMLRETLGISADGSAMTPELEEKVMIAVSNWYLNGTYSLSTEDLVGMTDIFCTGE